MLTPQNEMIIHEASLARGALREHSGRERPSPGSAQVRHHKQAMLIRSKHTSEYVFSKPTAMKNLDNSDLGTISLARYSYYANSVHNYIINSKRLAAKLFLLQAFFPPLVVGFIE